MLDIFLKIFDVIFPPPDCIKKIIDETSENFSRHFFLHKFTTCVALADYTNPFIKSAIIANKFYDYERAGTLLATLVDCWIETQGDAQIIFVPIPLSKTRQKSRGYNQVSRVLKNINHNNVTVLNLLSRNIDTTPQTSLARAERLKNVENAFLFNGNKSNDYSNKKVVIVDDVVTTGATVHSAQKILRDHLPKDCEIICLALAH